jgi:hypothetical protein
MNEEFLFVRDLRPGNWPNAEGSGRGARSTKMTIQKIKILGPRIPEQQLREMEMLLPWHAAGTLDAGDARRIDEALAREPELVKRYVEVCEECAETIHLNESLGGPSARAIRRLFAAIDGEPPRHHPAELRSKNSCQKKQKKSQSL